MANTYQTAFMNLILPLVGQQVGPDWADNINAALDTIDAHDHTSGKGQPIPLTGIAINSDLDMVGQSIDAVDVLTFAARSTESTDASCIYSKNGDMFWNAADGTPVQITSGGGINLSSIGAIGGDYSTSTASLIFTSATETFSFIQEPGIAANIDVADIRVYEPVSGGKFINIAAPTGLGSDYDITLPDALPASTQVVVMDSAGKLALSKQIYESASPAGVVQLYAGNSAPSGWLLCQGQAVSRSTYSTLFAAIGTLHGIGDGSTTFNVPDMRGMVPIGAGTSTRTDNSGAAYAGGSVGAYDSDKSASHVHPFSATSGNSSSRQWTEVGGTFGSFAAGGDYTLDNYVFAYHTHGVSGNTSAQTFGAGFLSTRSKPATVSMHYIIKA